MAADKYTFLNRDLSWLSFNHRVLMEAADETVPLYSRISFLSIFSSNLDEFFGFACLPFLHLPILNQKKYRYLMNIQKVYCKMCRQLCRNN